MVSTSGGLAEEKRRVAAPRFAAAGDPPPGEGAGSAGASSRVTASAATGPKKAAAPTRNTALIPDVAAGVWGSVVVGEPANSGAAGAGATSPPMIRPGP